MNIKDRAQERRDFWIGAGISVWLHTVVVLLLVLVWWLDKDPDPPKEEDRGVEVVLEDSELREEEPPLVEPPLEESPLMTAQDEEELPEENIPDEEEVEEAEEETEEPLDDEDMERYAVDQQTNEEEPDDAEHISDEAHRTEEEAVADVTTLEDVPHPEEDPEAPDQEADTEVELAMHAPEELSEPDLLDPEIMEELREPEESEEAEFEEFEEAEEVEEEVMEQARQYRDSTEMFVEREEIRDDAPREFEPLEKEALFGQDAAQVEEYFKNRDDEPVAEGGAAGAPQGRRLLTRWRENEDAMRASLENFLPHVQTGNHTSVNARAAAHASYIARMHRFIHVRWAMEFIPRIQAAHGNTHPINDMSLKTVVEIVIDAESGAILETGLAAPSGNTLFDAEALNITRNIGRQPDPPSAIVSHDGKVYVHWTFWRDQRQCGTFGVRIFRLQAEGDRRRLDGSWGEE